jgi:hypothetical protein
MSYAFKSALSASLLALTIASPIMISSPAIAAETIVRVDAEQTSFRSEVIDGQNIAYREAGDPNNPTVLLLHGFPT